MLTDRKEQLYIIAIQNLRRRVHFQQLTHELDTRYISERQFEKELKQNRAKYAITCTPLEDESDIHLIRDIINKIGNDDYSTSDVGELFSISTVPVDPFLELKNKILNGNHDTE